MKNKKYDYVIVGAGLTGAVFAAFAASKGKRCLVIDRRSHIGGNAYCENIEGITVHKYGPHIFHTSNKDVWDYVNLLCDFNNFRLNVLAKTEDGALVHLPFNMNTMYELFNTSNPTTARNTVTKEILKYQKEHGTEITNLEEQAVSMVGTTIYEKLIKGYTEKQWGRNCRELPPSIIKRLPVRYTYDNNYYNDVYQGIPVGGYNTLFENLLADSDVLLDTDFLKDREKYEGMGDKIVYTGCIDEFFGYSEGVLEYRKVEWDTYVENMHNMQGTAVINYTGKNTDFTRVIEHKHFETFNDDVYKNRKTVYSIERPSEWKKGEDCQYPINNERNNELYLKYKEKTNELPNYIFIGRLAEYKYYDMDKIIENIINISQTI